MASPESTDRSCPRAHAGCRCRTELARIVPVAAATRPALPTPMWGSAITLAPHSRAGRPCGRATSLPPPYAAAGAACTTASPTPLGSAEPEPERAWKFKTRRGRRARTALRLHENDADADVGFSTVAIVVDSRCCATIACTQCVSASPPRKDACARASSVVCSFLS